MIIRTGWLATSLVIFGIFSKNVFAEDCPPRPIGLSYVQLSDRTITFSVTSEPLDSLSPEAIDLAKQISELRAKSMLTKSKNGSGLISGIVTEFICIFDGVLYFGAKADQKNISASSNTKQLIEKSILENPTPRY